MNYETEFSLATDFFKKCLEVLKKKANDYAKDSDVFSNFKKIADVCDIDPRKTFLVFMTVKLARIVELLDKETKVGESLEDSLLDLANYSALMAIFLKEGEKDER